MDYNTEQSIVINSKSQKMIVRASAGTGKTCCLIGAIAKYRNDNPKAVIDAITFTRAAAAELKTRLSEQGIYDINISTIHVWARGYLEELADMYHFEMRVLQEYEIKQIMKSIIDAYPRKVEVSALYDFALNNKRLNLQERQQATFLALERRYVQYKRDNGLYDFTDYPLYLYDKLSEYNEKIYSVDALFVDELQDIDEEQSHIFEKVECMKKFYIGDSRQMIYGFRGASTEIFESIKGFDEYTLRQNYRSKQEIIDYADTFYKTYFAPCEAGEKNLVSGLIWSQRADINCTRGNGGKVYVVDSFGFCNNVNNEECNTSLAMKDVFSQAPMILCRTNRQVQLIKDAGYYNVSTIHQSKGLEYRAVIVVDTEVNSIDDLNVIYVGLTRARDTLMVVNSAQLIKYLNLLR